jgi:hypothetical protein
MAIRFLQLPHLMATSILNLFDEPASWQVIASGLAEGKLSSIPGPDGKQALQLDYDFHGGGGFVVARKELHMALPETFEIAFQLRGEGLRNHFEFKVADLAGTNAWRYQKQEFELPSDWQNCRIRERDLPFAWGPAGGGAPTVIGAVELVIAAGPGGRGKISFSNINLRDETLHAPKSVTASSSLPNQAPETVFELSSPSGWQADPADAHPWWEVDFGRMQRFGGLVVEWPPLMEPRAFEIEISHDRETWERIHQATHDCGTRSHIPAAHAEARYLRIQFAKASSAALRALSLRPDAFSHTPNEFIHAVATDFPRAWFPRYWYREQSYWTPIGSPDGRRRGLINEEGLVEVDEAAFSLEPFVLVGNRLVTWADVETEVSLETDGTPFPVVTWRTEGLSLTITPWMDGKPGAQVLRTNYQLETSLAHELRLVVAVRPFQVNPPWQAFRDLGGRSTVHQISCKPKELIVDARRVEFSHVPGEFGAATFEEGGVMEFLVNGNLPPRSEVIDAAGLASAAMAWPVPAKSGHLSVTLSVPFFKHSTPLKSDSHAAALAQWRNILSAVEWQVPQLAVSAIACFRTAAAHILINCDGPAIQPGPRRYTRSWVRDCVIMGSALSKACRPEVLENFLLWYAQFQREDGHIPSVVDRDGVDDLVEHDSHGQFIWGVCEACRIDPRRDLIEPLWEPVRKAAEHLLALRAQRMTPEYAQAERANCYGLLPESASHEGYLSHPVHSYWDDFWGIRGLEAAAEIALRMDHADAAERWLAEAKQFQHDVQASIKKVIAQHQLNYIPGSVEWADFDPTATANAIAQLDFADDLPHEPLHQMLDTYLAGFRKKHAGEIPWLNYTAYEIRIIGAFVRLGRREEAQELLDFFLSDRRPLEWNQWPEITWRDPRSPGHLGDIPHTWIAAEYLLAIAAMIASERESSDSLVLASGLPWSWISAEDSGFSVNGLMTRYGRLHFEIRASGLIEISLHVSGISMPGGGLFVMPPLPPGHRMLHACDATGNPLVVDPAAGCVTLTHLPISVRITLQAP